MNYYAGLDVSLEETAICVVDGTGRIVKEARAASEPVALAQALSQLDLPLERIGLEACSLTAWLHEGLRAAGLPAICIETRQANAAMKTMPNKTDRNDARALAQIMRTGWFRQVHVKSRQVARHGPRPRRGRPQARRHPPSHVERRCRVPLGQGPRQRRHGRSLTPQRRNGRTRHDA